MLSNKKKKKNSFLAKLSNTYRLVVLKQESYEERFSTTLTPIKIIFFLVMSFFLFGLFFWCVYAYTPIKHNIPGYPHEEIINDDIANKYAVDSLMRISKTNDLYFRNLQAVLRGENPQELDVGTDSIKNLAALNDYEISREDSIARAKVESESAIDINKSTLNQKKNMLEGVLLHKPVEGVISDGLNLKSGHYGIDLAAAEDTRVKAILPGTVVFSGFSASGGNEIHIQHEYNLVSIYKHNSAVLKNQGDKVIAGESIAIVGNSGEHSDGTHLHFEMWQKGQVLNPTDYFAY